MFNLDNISTAPDTFWHRLKRRFMAQPILSISKDGVYTLAWYWSNGEFEITKHGQTNPGGIIEIPNRCKVVYET